MYFSTFSMLILLVMVFLVQNLGGWTDLLSHHSCNQGRALNSDCTCAGAFYFCKPVDPKFEPGCKLHLFGGFPDKFHDHWHYGLWSSRCWQAVAVVVRSRNSYKSAFHMTNENKQVKNVWVELHALPELLVMLVVSHGLAIPATVQLQDTQEIAIISSLDCEFLLKVIFPPWEPG